MSSVRRTSLVKAMELAETTTDPEGPQGVKQVLDLSYLARQDLADGDANYKQAQYTAACGDYTKALQKTKLRDDRVSVPVRMLLFQILSRRASCYIKMKQYDEAIQDADTMLHLEIFAEKAYICKALAQRGRGDLDNALHTIRLACRHAPDKSHCMRLHASFLIEKGTPEKIIDPDASKPQHTHSEHEALEMMMNESTRSESQEATEDTARAVALGEMSEQHERELVQIKFRTKRGEALSHIGRFQDALRDVDAVLAMAPKDEHAHVLRIQCLIGAKEYETARVALERACSEFPLNEGLRDLLVDLMTKKKFQLVPTPSERSTPPSKNE